MSYLNSSLIALPIISISVFVYYRALLFVGENIELKWLSSIVQLFIWLVYAACILFLLFWFTAEFASKGGESQLSFWIPFLMIIAVFFVSAFFAYKLYKPRMDAAGIRFK